MQPNDTQPGVPPTPEQTPTLDSTPNSVPSAPVTPEQAPTPASMPFQPFGQPVASPDASRPPQASEQQPSPEFGNSPVTEPPKKSKLPLIIIVAVVVVLLAGGGVFAYSALNGTKDTADTTNNTQPDTEQPAGSDEPADTIARTDGTLDLAGSVSGNTEIAAQDVTVGLNEQVNLKNGLSLMVTKVERNFADFDSRYFKVKDDEEVVAVTVVAGSRNTNGNGVPKMSFIMQAPSSENIVTTFVPSLAEVDGMFDVGSGLDQGQQGGGRLVYLVKKGESPLKLNYSASYRQSGTDKTVKLSATFNL